MRSNSYISMFLRMLSEAKCEWYKDEAGEQHIVECRPIFEYLPDKSVKLKLCHTDTRLPRSLQDMSEAITTNLQPRIHRELRWGAPHPLEMLHVLDVYGYNVTYSAHTRIFKGFAENSLELDFNGFPNQVDFKANDIVVTVPIYPRHTHRRIPTHPLGFLIVSAVGIGYLPEHPHNAGRHLLLSAAAAYEVTP